MSTTASSLSELPDVLEEVARGAGDELRGRAGQDASAEQEARQRKVDAASRAMRAGHDFTAIAHAEKVGRDDARRTVGSDLLKRVEKAARRRREADDDYRAAVRQAVRIGLGHREVGQAAGVSHATVRAIAEKSDDEPAETARPVESVG
jgi:hypothetical protein